MALRLEVISEHKSLLGAESEWSFGPEGGTIGRSLRNDWVLPDRERFISGQHATIDYLAGSYYLADTSSNGVYINGAIEPVGKGQPRRLFNGDRVRMGNFEMRVHLDEGEDLAMPPDPEPSVVPELVEQLVPVDEGSSVMLLDEEEITGRSALAAAMLSDDSEDLPAAEKPCPVRKPLARPAEPAPAESDLLATFLRAAGIDPDDLHPSVDPAEVMTNAGELLHELVAGLSEMLVARSNVKAMFRLDQTTVLPRHNNPLKLSIDTVDSLRQLLVGREGEYLGPLDSVREASRDLCNHHDAVVAGMIRAFSAYIDRFSPDVLEEHFADTADRKPMFGGIGGRRKFWDMYRDLYPILTEKSTASLPQQFAEDFVRFYEKQLKDFKRREVTLGDTQRLDMAQLVQSRDAAAATPAPYDDATDSFDPTDTLTLDDDDLSGQRQAG